MSNTLYESEIEQIALELLRDENGYTVLYGPDLAEGAHPERTYSEVILANRLRAAIQRLNPHLPAEARADAFKQALRVTALTVMENNKAFHRLLTEGVDVKFRPSQNSPLPAGEGLGVRAAIDSP